MVPNPGAITGAFPFPCLNPTGAKTNRRRQRWGCGGLGPAAMCIYHLGSRDGAIPVSGGRNTPQLVPVPLPVERHDAGWANLNLGGSFPT